MGLVYLESKGVGREVDFWIKIEKSYGERIRCWIGINKYLL